MYTDVLNNRYKKKEGLEMSGRPRWAKAKIRFYLATCWTNSLNSDYVVIAGVDWFNDLLLQIFMLVHNYLGFLTCKSLMDRIRILEKYDDC